MQGQRSGVPCMQRTNAFFSMVVTVSSKHAREAFIFKCGCMSVHECAEHSMKIKDHKLAGSLLEVCKTRHAYTYTRIYLSLYMYLYIYTHAHMRVQACRYRQLLCTAMHMDGSVSILPLRWRPHKTGPEEGLACQKRLVMESLFLIPLHLTLLCIL